MDAVKAYRNRRDARVKARADAEDGRWVTTENDHKIHFNEQGEPDKGNPHVISAMKGGKKTGLEKKAEDFHKAKLEPFAEGGKEVQDWAKREGYKAVYIPEYKDKKGNVVQKEHYAYADKYGRTVSIGDIKEAYKKKTGGGQTDRGYANKEYGYGPGDSREAKYEVKGGEYEALPFSFKKNGLSKEETKQVRDTIGRFMSNAKEGDVYVVGGGFGSSGGQKFEVTTYRGGKPALRWVGSSWNPVLMNRANVEKFIRNGAKLVEK